jgi:ribosome maturation factor RimP
VLKTPVEKKNVLDGTLENADGEAITLSIAGERLTIPFSNISKTRLTD